MVERQFSSLVTGPVEGKISWEKLSPTKQEIWLQVFQDYLVLAQELFEGRHNQLTSVEKVKIIEETEPFLENEAISRMCACFAAGKQRSSGLSRLAGSTIKTIFKGLAWHKGVYDELREVIQAAGKYSSAGEVRSRNLHSRPRFSSDPNTGCGE